MVRAKIWVLANFFVSTEVDKVHHCAVRAVSDIYLALISYIHIVTLYCPPHDSFLTCHRPLMF